MCAVYPKVSIHCVCVCNMCDAAVTVTMVNDTFVYQEGTPSHRLSVCVSMTGTIERDLTIVTMATEGTAKCECTSHAMLVSSSFIAFSLFM